MLLFCCSLPDKARIAPGEGYFATLPFLVACTPNWVHVQGGNIGIMSVSAQEEQFYLGWPMIEKLLGVE